MRRTLYLLALASAIVLPAAAGIFGTVRGIVHDLQHHPIEGAGILLRARFADWQREAVTDAEGRFQIDAVPAGQYTIRIRHDGFHDAERNLTVATDSAPLLHFPLAVASLAQRVEVNESASAVDPTSSSSSSTLTRSDLSAMPGATRTNSLDFITNITPGATMVHDQLHIRGGHQVSWLVDGVPVPNTNIASNLGAQFDPKDIDVIEIQRGGYSAEYGDRTFGVINVIPRSGFERDREMEIAATYGSYHSTDSQISLGDHTNRFAYYASLSASRTDAGLMTPEPGVLHDNTLAGGGFTSLIFNATPNDQFRLVASVRADYFQIPNTADQQAAGFRDAQRERDAFANFSWLHTAGPGLLFTLAPFYHWNHVAYDGSPRAFGDSGTPADAPPTPADHRDSYYEGALASLAVTRGRHNARVGLYGFAQQDDARFALVANDGSGSSLSQTEKPRGGLFALFAEDQFRLTEWFTVNGGIRYSHFSGGLTEDKASPRIGGALRVPKLNWVFRAFYGRYYQAPPLSTVSGPLLQFALDQGFGFLPLRGETDEQREFGVAIPLRGWTFDVSNFQTHARNFFDHAVLGNSNIFFPVTIARARIRGTEVTLRSPRLAGRVQLRLAYSRQTAEGAGGVAGGLTDFSPPAAGFFFLDHDQHDTLATGFHVLLPSRAWVSGNFAYGSGFLDGNGPGHLPGHQSFDLAAGKSFGERFSLSFTAQNLGNTRYLIDSSNTFGGTHWNYPRQFTGEMRYRFRY
ncbi:MAG TPA: TonB-dependent receptor [Candidatus Acidoferrales bacterium]|nr:TonB-dependent receptor [Candidatus Acidoferrales bacterium]